MNDEMIYIAGFWEGSDYEILGISKELKTCENLCKVHYKEYFKEYFILYYDVDIETIEFINNKDSIGCELNYWSFRLGNIHGYDIKVYKLQ